MNVPKSVVETDHRLEGVHDRASEDLAEHRWHWTLDESNPGRVSARDYAEAVGRKQPTIFRYAKGWALYRDRSDTPGVSLAGFTIQDAIRLAELRVEDQAFAEAIAEGSGRPIAQVARGDNRHRMREMVGQAKDRAERRGTDPVDEARKLAAEKVRVAQGQRERQQRKASRHEARWLAIESNLSVAKVKLTSALKEAEGVEFTDEELDLLRGTIRQVQAVLQLLDMRMGGEINVDWEAELAKLGDQP